MLAIYSRTVYVCVYLCMYIYILLQVLIQQVYLQTAVKVVCVQYLYIIFLYNVNVCYNCILSKLYSTECIVHKNLYLRRGPICIHNHLIKSRDKKARGANCHQ